MNILNSSMLKGLEVYYYPQTGTKVAIYTLTPKFSHCSIYRGDKTYTGACRGTHDDGRRMALCRTISKVKKNTIYSYENFPNYLVILEDLGDFVRIV